MNRTINAKTLEIIVEICIQNNAVLPGNIGNKDGMRKLLSKFTLEHIYYLVANSESNNEFKTLMLSILTNAGKENYVDVHFDEISSVKEEIDELKSQIKNLNQKITLLSDALSKKIEN